MRVVVAALVDSSYIIMYIMSSWEMTSMIEAALQQKDDMIVLSFAVACPCNTARGERGALREDEARATTR